MCQIWFEVLNKMPKTEHVMELKRLWKIFVGRNGFYSLTENSWSALLTNKVNFTYSLCICLKKGWISDDKPYRLKLELDLLFWLTTILQLNPKLLLDLQPPDVPATVQKIHYTHINLYLCTDTEQQKLKPWADLKAAILVYTAQQEL